MRAVANFRQRGKLLKLPLLLMSLLLVPAWRVVALTQSGGSFTLYGDLKIDESKMPGLKPVNFEVILQSERLSTMGRQMVARNGRYRFENLSNGTYYIVVMLEGSEVASVRVRLNGIVGTDYRQDIALEWRPDVRAGKEEKGGVISAALHYPRSESNQSLFEKAEDAINRKNYESAASLLQRVTRADVKDFESWTELGTVHFKQKDTDQAEKDYLRALELEPSSLLALIDLGKLRLAEKNFDGAIEILTRATSLRPPSAEANYFLGEAYLNIRKGSKAVAYMNEAIRIDPIGKAEIHLRIAAIYDNVCLKNLAAAEYQAFLKKRPDYQDRKKLERYITENKKP